MPTSDIRTYTLRWLARREHSQHELEFKLKLKGFSQAQIEEELSALKNAKLQSDARFTEVFVNEKIRLGFGPRAIEIFLKERGITERLIDQFMSVYSNDFWQQQLQALCLKKFNFQKFKQGKDGLAEKARQYRFLTYRGFEPEAIHALLRFGAEAYVEQVMNEQ